MSKSSQGIESIFYIPENNEELADKINQLLRHASGPEMLYLYYLMVSASERGLLNKDNQ